MEDRNLDQCAEIINQSESSDSSLASRVPLHPVLSSTILNQRSKDSDYSALDFLCDMCLEVQNSPTVLNTSSFEKFAEVHANFPITKAGSFDRIEDDLSLVSRTDDDIQTKTFMKDSSRPNILKPPIPSPLSQSTRVSGEYSKLDFLVDTCIEVEANQIASMDSLERFADEIEFNLPSHTSSIDDDDRHRSFSFSPHKLSSGEKSFSNSLLFSSMSRDEDDRKGGIKDELFDTRATYDSCPGDQQHMKVNVHGVDMAVRIVQIGNNCYLEPVHDKSSEVLSNIAATGGMNPSISMAPAAIYSAPLNASSTGQDPQYIMSRSANARANATDISVDRLSKLMRMNSISPRSDSLGFTLLTKCEDDNDNDNILTAMATDPSYNFPSSSVDSSQSVPFFPTPQYYMNYTPYHTMRNDFPPQPFVETGRPQAMLKFEQNNFSHMHSHPLNNGNGGGNGGGGGGGNNGQYHSIPVGVNSPVFPDTSSWLPPKHIYRTACDTYRVQVGKGVRGNPNGKFSRNIRNEIDAMWLCEIALLFIDCPPSLSEMLCNGNYKCLLQRGLVSSPSDFLACVQSQIERMKELGFLKDAEWQRATKALQELSIASPTAASSTTPFFAPIRAPTGVSSLDMNGVISSRKKRRRHNVLDKSTLPASPATPLDISPVPSSADPIYHKIRGSLEA